jgi:hypothetical protein
MTLENKIHPHVAAKFKELKKNRAFNLIENPLATWELLDKV